MVCFCVCVQGFIQDFESWKGGGGGGGETPKVSVDVEGIIAHNN